MPRGTSKQERARAYNRANGQLKGMITQIEKIPEELPHLDRHTEIIISRAVTFLRVIINMIIDRQKELIKEGK